MKNIIFYLIVAILAFFVIEAIYSQFNKKSAKSTSLACHKNITVFERIYLNEELENAKQSIKARNFQYAIKLQPSIYMQTKLFDYIKKEDIETIFTSELNKEENVLKEETKNVIIDILVYENDKKDPGKKTAKSKLYAGYLVISIWQNEKQIYRVQVDFLEDKGEDIPSRIKCAIETIFSAK